MDDQEVEKLIKYAEDEVAEACSKLLAQLEELQALLLRLMKENP